MKPFSIVLAAIVWWFALEAVLVDGGIWDIRAHPREHVEVWFNDGQYMAGRLSKDWRNSWILTTNDREIHFADSAQKAMAFPPPTNGRDFASHWRATVPLILVNIPFLLFCVMTLRSQFRSRRAPMRPTAPSATP